MIGQSRNMRDFWKLFSDSVRVGGITERAGSTASGTALLSALISNAVASRWVSVNV